ncbi:hypothetical protein MJH12_09665 [bacterium]|nr:hypothetical protein [bacterium]
MLALFSICILCYTLDALLIQELTKPLLPTLWVPVLAWFLAILLFTLIAKKTKYLVYFLQILYFSLFIPKIGHFLNPLIPNFSLQIFLIFFLAILLTLIETFPPSLILANIEQKMSFQRGTLKLNFMYMISSLSTYSILILFSILYLLSLFHPLFIGTTNQIDHMVLFVVSIPFIYSTRKLI